MTQPQQPKTRDDVEQDQFDRAVTDWELRRSFERL